MTASTRLLSGCYATVLIILALNSNNIFQAQALSMMASPSSTAAKKIVVVGGGIQVTQDKLELVYLCLIIYSMF